MRPPDRTHHVDKQLRRTMQSKEYRRRVQQMRSIDMTASERETLAALLLVEMTCRPSAHRFLEWLLAAIIPAIRGVRALRPRTLGPLQMVDAPRAFSAAVDVALRKIRQCKTDDELAVHWYGSAVRQPGSCMSYPQALQKCRTLLSTARSNSSMP